MKNRSFGLGYKTLSQTRYPPTAMSGWSSNDDFHFDSFPGRLTRFSPEFSVVLDRLIPPLLELERRVDGQFLAGALPEGLGPLGLARVLLLFEVLGAF